MKKSKHRCASLDRAKPEASTLHREPRATEERWEQKDGNRSVPPQGRPVIQYQVIIPKTIHTGGIQVGQYRED